MYMSLYLSIYLYPTPTPSRPSSAVWIMICLPAQDSAITRYCFTSRLMCTNQGSGSG